MTEEITAGDIAVRIPNAGNVLFPDNGITKEDLARYYADAGQFTISTVRARLDSADDPWAGLTRTRHGLGRAAKRLADLSRD